MSYCVRQTAGELPPGTAVFYRSLIGAVVLLPFTFRSLPILVDKRSLTLWLRGFAGCGASFFYFWNIQMSSVGDACVLLNLSPVMSAALGWYILKERLRFIQILGICVSLAGLTAVAVDEHSTLTKFVVITGAFGALLSAAAFTALRRAAAKFSPVLVVLAYMISGLVLSLALEHESIIQSVSLFTSSGSFWSTTVAWAILAGICGLGGQLLFTLAFISLEAAVATTLSLTSVIWGTFLEIGLDGRSVGFSMWVAYALVLCGAGILQLSALRLSVRAKRSKATEVAA